MELLKILASSATNTSSNVASAFLQRAALAAYDTLASSNAQQQPQPYRNTRSSSQRQTYTPSSASQQDIASTIVSSIIYYTTFALSLASRYLPIPASYLSPLAILSRTSTLYTLITKLTTLDLPTVLIVIVSGVVFFKLVAYLFRWVLWWVRVALRLAGVAILVGAVMYVAGRGLEGSLHDLGEVVGWGMGVLGEGGYVGNGGGVSGASGAKGGGYGGGAGTRRNVGGGGRYAAGAGGGGRWT